jgi:F-type H+-transporting ATPase subunit alpha
MLKDLSHKLFKRLDGILAETEPTLEVAEIARVLSLGSGVARIAGFTDLAANELVAFASGGVGIAASLGEHSIGVVVLGGTEHIRPGEKVRRLHRVIDVPVGEALLGRVVDALGRPLDESGAIKTDRRMPVERPAPPIMHRAPVEVPLQTGIKAIDAAIPVGRGQRELIIGDRQSGKTAIAVDTILNQASSDVISVYCAIGQRASAVARVISVLNDAGALERTIVVAASGNDPPGLQFIAPYAATSMAEYFLEQGRDVLIVYDDLTRHARAYRELSLLLRRPPGREAYPGDIFYIHARLLERATRLRDVHGGGSMTALPVIETQAQNISAYIPTNLISITDGQIYLSPELFEKGQLPAIDIGSSVSRVGGKAQLPAYRAVAGDLRLNYSQFEGQGDPPQTDARPQGARSPASAGASAPAGARADCRASGRQRGPVRRHRAQRHRTRAGNRTPSCLGEPARFVRAHRGRRGTGKGRPQRIDRRDAHGSVGW